MAENYPGFVYGNLRIPCYVYQSGVLDLEDVLCRYNPTELILPEDIAAYRSQLIKKKGKEAEGKGSAVRLRDYSIKRDDSRAEKLNLILMFQPCTWSTFSSTNLSLDERILRDEYGRKVSIREKYIKDPLNLNDVLGNATGVCATVISEPDHKLLMVERSTELGVYPGLYGDAAGGFMRDIDRINGVPNPFKTIQREAEEEAGLKCSINDFKLLGVGRSIDYLHAEIWGELRTPLTVQEIYDMPKRDEWEFRRLFDVPFEPKEVMKYVSKTIEQIPVGVPSGSNVWVVGRSPEWAPSHAISVIQSLEKEYEHERVMRDLKNI